MFHFFNFSIVPNDISSFYTEHEDEKIKLWLFLPGRHSSVVETAQTAVSGLRGIVDITKPL